MNPAYLQQVSNTINAMDSNLGTKPRKKNDLVVTSRLDYQPTSRDTVFLSFNVNYFNSPGGIITVSPVAVYGIQTLANAEVHDFQASLGWTHAFSSKLLNEFHAGGSDDNQLATRPGLLPERLQSSWKVRLLSLSVTPHFPLDECLKGNGLWRIA